jgi:hypothetical protein
MCVKNAPTITVMVPVAHILYTDERAAWTCEKLRLTDRPHCTAPPDLHNNSQARQVVANVLLAITLPRINNNGLQAMSHCAILQTRDERLSARRALIQMASNNQTGRAIDSDGKISQVTVAANVGHINFPNRLTRALVLRTPRRMKQLHSLSSSSIVSSSAFGRNVMCSDMHSDMQ